MTTLEQQATVPANLRSVVQFLRGSNSGMKIRVGALNGKRVDYFKGAFPLANFALN
jgi:translocation protein SEC62